MNGLVTRTVSAQGALHNTGSIRTRYRVFLDAGYFNSGTGSWNVDRDERLFWLEPGQQFSMTLSRSFSMNPGDGIAAQVFAWAIATSAGQLPGPGQEIGAGSLFEYTEPSAPTPPPPPPSEPDPEPPPPEPEIPEPRYAVGQRVRFWNGSGLGANNCLAFSPYGAIHSRNWMGSHWRYSATIEGTSSVGPGSGCTLNDVLGHSFHANESQLVAY